MHEPEEGLTLRDWIERPHEPRWRRPHHREQRPDRVQHACNPPEREPGRTERGYFEIGWIAEASDEVHGIRDSVGRIERVILLFEQTP
jgi:hypothetical protein